VRGRDGVSFDLNGFAMSGDARVSYTTPLGSTLYVELSSAVLREELTHGKSKIVAMINEELKREVVKEVVLR